MNFPTLFKKTSTGAIQFWTISSGEYDGVGFIDTSYGQLNTDNPQITTEDITRGKNIGKKNETTPGQQAEKEARSRWEKQKKKGYVESIPSAQADEVDALIEGGIAPMLAHKFTDHGHKIKYPAFIQPKLDGIRCIAILKNGKCTLWSRTRKPITSMPHIIAQIESLALESYEEIIFDGELYNHAFRNNFEHIVSMVRQEEPDDNHKDVEYHIYDFPSRKEAFEFRFGWFKRAWRLLAADASHLRLVDTELINSEDEALHFYNRYRQIGYEGAILRNANGLYVNKRSYDLQKMKEFEDGEFEILGVEEGRGKLAGHVGAFICRMDSGKEFLAKMSGDTGQLKMYFQDHSLWKGKRLTVQYQGLTGAEQVPRFPVGIAIRDYE